MIPWIPLLTAGLSLAGSLFGNNSKQTQSENSSTSTSGLTTGQTGLQSQVTQQSNQQQQSSQQSSQQSQEQQTGVTNRLDDDTLAQLTQAVQSALAPSAGSGAVDQRLNQLSGGGGDFDVEQYVNGIMTGAKSRAVEDFQIGGNQAAARAGSSAGGNSAVALMQSRIGTRLNSDLAATEADARMRAEQLRMQQQESTTGQISTLASQTDQRLGSLLGALVQATERQSVNTTGTTAGTTQGGTTTTGTVTENTNQTQQQVQSQTGLENVTGKVSSSKNESSFGDFLKGIGNIFNTSFEFPS